MLKNYFKIAIRNLMKHKAFSLINVVGLAVGMAACLLIALYVQDELSYDKNHTYADRIYRLQCKYFLPKNAGEEQYAVTGPGVAPLIVKDYAEIAQAARILRSEDELIRMPHSNESLYETIYFADSTLLQIFTLPLLEGDPRTVLTEPFTVVLSKDAAFKYFGRTNIIGETLTQPGDSQSFKITGVLDDQSVNSHLHFDFIASYSTMYRLGFRWLQSWWAFNTYTYLLLKPNTDVPAFEEKIRNISHRYIPTEETESGYRQEYSLMNVRDIHLQSHLRNEISVNNKTSNIYIFSCVGVLILFIACVNFMNLSTARSMIRAKEVGMRKVVGANRAQLIRQFLSESTILAVLAFVLAVLLSEITLPAMNSFTDKKLHLDFLGNGVLLIFAVGVIGTVGLLAGTYPAVVLSSFRPSWISKSGLSSRPRSVFRKTLVVFQFTISIGLIAGILTVFKQLQYMRLADLGFSRDRIIFISTHGDRKALEQFRSLQNELARVPGVIQSSLSSKVPGKELGNNVVRLGWDEKADWSDMRYLAVDYDFISLYGLTLVSGRAFDRKLGTDESEAFMINESAVERLGFSNAKDALGKPLTWQRKKGRVVGVVKDFHFMSLQKAIEPFIAVINPHDTEYLSVRISTERLSQLIAQIESVYRAVMPERSFEYHFLDEEFDKSYQAEDRFGTIFLTFTGLAIFVACLGLLGLISFTAEQRTKEIGVRKVLGAGVSAIVILLTKDFVKLILAAMILATPVSYWIMDQWLQDFAYRTEVGYGVYLAAGTIGVVIALLTVSYQAVKAATANPVDALKYE